MNTLQPHDSPFDGPSDRVPRDAEILSWLLEGMENIPLPPGEEAHVAALESRVLRAIRNAAEGEAVPTLRGRALVLMLGGTSYLVEGLRGLAKFTQQKLKPLGSRDPHVVSVLTGLRLLTRRAQPLTTLTLGMSAPEGVALRAIPVNTGEAASMTAILRNPLRIEYVGHQDFPSLTGTIELTGVSVPGLLVVHLQLPGSEADSEADICDAAIGVRVTPDASGAATALIQEPLGADMDVAPLGAESFRLTWLPSDDSISISTDP